MNARSNSALTLTTSSLALALLTALSAPAQEAKPAPPAEPIVSFAFDGGSLAKYAATIRKAGTNINITLPGLASEVEVPKVELTQVSVEAALRAAGSLVPSNFTISVAVLSSDEGQPVYALSVFNRSNQMAASTGVNPANEPSLRVFSLMELTRKLPGETETSVLDADTILSALDTGLSIGDAKKKVEMRYHEDSYLLFVKGTETQTLLARDILQSVLSDVNRVRDAERRAAQEARKSEARKEAREKTSTGR